MCTHTHKRHWKVLEVIRKKSKKPLKSRCLIRFREVYWLFSTPLLHKQWAFDDDILVLQTLFFLFPLNFVVDVIAYNVYPWILSINPFKTNETKEKESVAQLHSTIEKQNMRELMYFHRTEQILLTLLNSGYSVYK